MKELRLLLATMLAFVFTTAAWASYSEEFTDSKGITYYLYFESNNTYYARIIRIETSNSSLEIPDKVTSPHGFQAVVIGFSSSFTCNCPNLTALIIKESTYRGVVAGDFWGMSKLNHIYFHDPSTHEPSTGLSWRLDPNTTFNLLNGKVIVHLSQLVEPLVYGARLTYDPNESYLNVIQSWKNHAQVEEVQCNFKGGSIGTDGYEFGVAPFTGSNYDIFSSPSPYEAALLYINKYATTAYIPKYLSIVTDYVPQNWKITRFGYPGITTNLDCTNLTTLTFAGNITIDEGVIFDYCSKLEKIVFNGNADIRNLRTSTSSFTTPFFSLKEIEFHGDALLGSSLSRLSNLEKVYFYGNIPDSPKGLASLSNLTVYVDMDIYEIAEWKQNHSSWSSINMQPIDPSSSYRKVTIRNPGEGTFKVQYYHDGSATMVTIKPNSTKTIEVDKGTYIYTIDFSLPESSNYRLSGFVFNETTNVELGYGIAVNEKTNTLTAHYRQLTFPIGTPLDIHFTKVGDGDMVFREYDENQWALIDPENDEWLELHDMSHDGEEYNYTITYYDQMDLDLAFGCSYNKPVDGIKEECIVIVNGVPEPIESWQVTEDNYGFTADYLVHIDGDMDIQIIHQNNGRNLSVVNGDGGTIALYKEGETETEPELVSTIDNGISYEKVLPKDIAHYAVITPVNGKEVFALFVNKPLSETARLQLDASQYLQEDGTYRVPLSGFADGKDTYRLTVLYVDRPSYSFNLAVVGDGSLKCIPFREEDGDIQAIKEVTVSEANGRNQTAKAFYDEIGETGYVEFWLTAPKEGEIVKVYMDGVDVSDKFKPKENMDNQLRGVIASVPKDDYLGVLSSVSLLAVYEENKDVVRWKAQMVGEVGNGAFNMSGHDLHFALNADNPSDTFVDSDTEDPTITSGAVFNGVLTVPTGYTFNVLFNGQNLSSHFEYENTENGLDIYYAELECTGTELSKLLTNGFWTIEIMKKKITWTAKVTGAINERTSTQLLINGGDVLDMDFVGLETTQETATFNPVDIYASDWSVSIVVKQGQKVRFLFNGDDVTKQVKMNDNYPDDRVSFSLNESTSTLSQFLVDGLWVFEIDRPDIIEFADDEVKRICVENWDTDGDGELSKAEAAAVTTLADSETGKSVFRENTTITSFDELQYFTGVTTIDEYAFRKCTALASVKFHDGVKHLHNYSFSGCSSLQHIQLPDKLDGLGSQVFASSGLTSIFIPKTITRIAFDAFLNCKQLLSIVIEDGAAKYSSPNGCNAVIYVQSGVRLLYAGCRNTVIPDDVNAIWTNAFYFQDELKKIVIPNSVGTIRDNAFYGCQNLTSVVMTRTQPLLFAGVGTDAFGRISPDCVLTVPAGTRQAYIDAGWTTKEPDENGVSDPNGLFLKIVEAPAELKGDINVDGTVDISDVTKLVNEILGK